MRVSYDFFEAGNCFRKLTCVCKPGGVVKTRGSKYCCSCFSLEDTKKRRIYWFGSSYAIDEFLQGGIDMRSLFIAYIALEFVDDTGKVFSYY